MIQKAKLIELYEAGLTLSAIAAELDVNAKAVGQAISRYGLRPLRAEQRSIDYEIVSDPTGLFGGEYRLLDSRSTRETARRGNWPEGLLLRRIRDNTLVRVEAAHIGQRLVEVAKDDYDNFV